MASLKPFEEWSLNISEICMIAKKFKLKKLPDHQVILPKISGKCNFVAHDLCQLARTGLCSGVLQARLRPAHRDRFE